MTSFLHIFKYEWVVFLRNRFQMTFILLTLALGCYAIYYGKQEIDKQNRAIRDVQLLDHKERVRIVNAFAADTTSAQGKQVWQQVAVPRFSWYRHFYTVTFPPSALAGLSLGQRDLQPYYYKLKAISLYYQIFQNEIANPQKLLTGNFDLAFVIIYIFPLLIISFTYGIISIDKDRGIYSLLRSQSIPTYRVALLRLCFYLVIVGTLAFILNAAAIVIMTSGNIGSSRFILWQLVTFGYCLFWFMLMYLIIAFNMSSPFNAMSGLGAWLLFLILIPSTLNVIISIATPLNTSVLTGISRRSGVVDEEKEENQLRVINEFLTRRPDLDFGKEVIMRNLTAKGFAAFTRMKDENSAKLVAGYQYMVNQRERQARSFDVINPAVNAQSMFNTLAQTDLYSFQQFYRSVRSFHAELVDFYYPNLFSDQNFTLSKISRHPQFKLQLAERSIILPLLWLIIASGLIGAAAFSLSRSRLG